MDEPLLRRVLDSVPISRRQNPELVFLVVTGPRINTTRPPRRRGARIVGCVPDLYRHPAACDVAIMQGGLPTCMELASAGRPFPHIPLQHHLEQNFHVRPGWADTEPTRG